MLRTEWDSVPTSSPARERGADNQTSVPAVEIAAEHPGVQVRTGLESPNVALDNAVKLITKASGKQARALDKFYTRDAVARSLYATLCQHIDVKGYLCVEPSAGNGAFFKLLPPRSLGIDIDPQCPGAIRDDFLSVELPSGRPIAIIGNPPFGKNASMAIRFFNHAARSAEIIAFVVPKTFRKSSCQYRLDPAFHLIHEEEVPSFAFLFEGAPYDVPTIFQIWQRREVPRERIRAVTSNPHFAFVSADQAHLVMRRIGARAGAISFDFDANPNSHYFIKCLDPLAYDRMLKLDLTWYAKNTAGNPSIARSEIIEMYGRALEKEECNRIHWTAPNGLR